MSPTTLSSIQRSVAPNTSAGVGGAGEAADEDADAEWRADPGRAHDRGTRRGTGGAEMDAPRRNARAILRIAEWRARGGVVGVSARDVLRRTFCSTKLRGRLAAGPGPQRGT